MTGAFQYVTTLAFKNFLRKYGLDGVFIESPISLYEHHKEDNTSICIRQTCLWIVQGSTTDIVF